MVIVDEFSAGVTGGVDTHLEVHVAAALDPIGGLLGVESFEAGRAGEDKLVAWLVSFGPVARVGVEGTGSYGAGLARRLRAAEIDVVEVDRQNRQARRRHGKSDPLDAVEAARAAQGGRAVGRPRPATGMWKPFGRCWSLVVAPTQVGVRPSTRSAILGSLPLMSCENACRECQPPCSARSLLGSDRGPVQTR